MKGPVLSHQLYGELHRRVCSDVDVLVREADFARAAVVLAQAGYESEVPLTGTSLRAHRARRHDLAFGHADGTLIELHAHIAQPHYSYRVDLERWFARAIEVDISGRRMRAPCAEHALVLAIVHGTKHTWTRLDLLIDVLALSTERLDWDEVRGVLRGAGGERAAGIALWLLESLFGKSVPKFFFDGETERMARAIRRRLLGSAELSYWETRHFDIAVRERLSDRLRYAAHLGLRLRL